jgi:hypothetical protein
MNELRSTSTGYDEDFYAWTQHQAQLLRSLERLGPELPADIDLSHVAEEIEDLGKAELRGAKSLIRNIFVHLIKAASDPQADAVGHWREETALFHDDLPEYFAPSMRQLIDIQQLWRRALNRAELALRRHGGTVSLEAPSDCPYTLQEILAEDFDFDRALAKLRGPERRA